MLAPADILQLPCTRELIDGGIAYALHSLPYQHRAEGASYDRLRRAVAGAAVELSFRRHLSEQKVPFEVKGALPFTERDRYDVMLRGRRCEIKSFLIRHHEQVSQLQRNPESVLKAPALVASDEHAAEGQSPHDLYLFAFLPGLVMTSPEELQKAMNARQPYCLVHVMPEAWNRPSRWSPLGELVLKAESKETQIIEISGQDEAYGRHSLLVELPPQRRVEVPNSFFSLSHLHARSRIPARIGIYSPTRRETYLIGMQDWNNIWVYSTNILLVGYITREDFSRRARFLAAGSHVFQYSQTRVKNLAVPASHLRPLAELLEQVRG